MSFGTSAAAVPLQRDRCTHEPPRVSALQIRKLKDEQLTLQSRAQALISEAEKAGNQGALPVSCLAPKANRRQPRAHLATSSESARTQSALQPRPIPPLFACPLQSPAAAQPHPRPSLSPLSFLPFLPAGDVDLAATCTADAEGLSRQIHALESQIESEKATAKAADAGSLQTVRLDHLGR